VQVFRTSCVWYQNFWYQKQTWQTIRLQLLHAVGILVATAAKVKETRMWANAQRDGRPAEYRWRRLFNAAKFG